MKKRYFFKEVCFIFITLCIILLASCSAFTKQTGSVSFTLSQDVMRSAIQKSESFIVKDDILKDFEYTESFNVSVSLTGTYSDSQSLTFTKEEIDTNKQGLFVVFNEIPVGETVTAEVAISSVRNYMGVEKSITRDVYKGLSDSLVIGEGENELPVYLKYIKSDDVKYTVEFYLETEAGSGEYKIDSDKTYEGGFNVENESYAVFLAEMLKTAIEGYSYNDDKSVFPEYTDFLLGNPITIKLYFDKNAPVVVQSVSEGWSDDISGDFTLELYSNLTYIIKLDNGDFSKGTISYSVAEKEKLPVVTLVETEYFDLETKTMTPVKDSLPVKLVWESVFRFKSANEVTVVFWEEPEEYVEISYTINAYRQKVSTVFDKELGLEKQLEIFEKDEKPVYENTTSVLIDELENEFASLEEAFAELAFEKVGNGFYYIDRIEEKAEDSYDYTISFFYGRETVTYNIYDADEKLICDYSGLYGDSVSYKELSDTLICGWRVTAESFDGDVVELSSVNDADLSKSDFASFLGYKTVNFIALLTPPVTDSYTINYRWQKKDGGYSRDELVDTFDVTYAADSTKEQIEELVQREAEKTIEDKTVKDGYVYVSDKTEYDYEKHSLIVYFDRIKIKSTLSFYNDDKCIYTCSGFEGEEIDYSPVIDVAEKIKKENYTFKGWNIAYYDSEDAELPVETKSNVTDLEKEFPQYPKVVLTASWVEDSFVEAAVIFEYQTVDGESYETDSEAEPVTVKVYYKELPVSQDATDALKASAIKAAQEELDGMEIKEGFVPDLTNIDVDVSYSIKALSLTCSITIKFNRVSSAFTFINDNETIAEFTGLYGATVDYSAVNVSEKEKYILKGWDVKVYTISDGTLNELSTYEAGTELKEIFETFPAYAKVEFTAVWELIPDSSLSFYIVDVKVVEDKVSDLINLAFDDKNTFSANSDFSSYKWYLDGTLIPSETKNSFVITDDISAGVHQIMLVVTKNDEPYSAVISFRIQK